MLTVNITTNKNSPDEKKLPQIGYVGLQNVLIGRQESSLVG